MEKKKNQIFIFLSEALVVVGQLVTLTCQSKKGASGKKGTTCARVIKMHEIFNDAFQRGKTRLRKRVGPTR